jgi:hypothetical protein
MAVEALLMSAGRKTAAPPPAIKIFISFSSLPWHTARRDDFLLFLIPTAPLSSLN